jgi:hypothetical protein
MGSVEEYARRWTTSEEEELDTLSEWIKSIPKLLKSRIHHLSGKMHTIYPSVFKKPEVVNELRRLHVLRSRTFQNEADYLQIS